MSLDNQKKQDLFEQVALLLNANGAPVNDDVLALMEPLLNGSMSYEEHRAWLKTMIEEFEA
jgi:hypothetical protein